MRISGRSLSRTPSLPPAFSARIVLRLLLDPLLGTRFPFATLFFAVMVAAWYGGFRPALFAALLGGVGSAWFLLPPRHTWALSDSENLAGISLYLAVSTGIALLGGGMSTARKQAERIVGASGKRNGRACVSRCTALATRSSPPTARGA